jgi:CRP/FNR family transcriptional regulator, nitrogen fixation regulation protein
MTLRIEPAKQFAHRMNIANVQPVKVKPVGLDGPIEKMGAPMQIDRGAEIFGGGEPTDYLYKVVSGAVCTYKVLMDGRRQVESFYLPGDIFGYELGGEHSLSAEATINSKLLMVRRSAIVALTERDSSVTRQLWMISAKELQRAQEHLMLLVKTAQERVVCFLLEMAERTAGANEIDLPMSRQNIADYLGLTIETISRVLTQLESSGAIALGTSRHIILGSRKALSRMNS